MKLSRRRLDYVLAGLVLAGLLAVICLALWNQAQKERGRRNYSLIDDGLYLGALVPEPPPRASVVLNLCELEDRYQCEIHVWESIRDGAPAPSLDWLRKQVAFIEAHRQAGRVVYVHCLNGVSRGALVVIAYVMAKHDWSRDQAFEWVRLKRSVIRPNAAFRRLLLEWERERRLLRPVPGRASLDATRFACLAVWPLAS